MSLPETPEFPEIPDPELIDVVSANEEEDVRFISVRSVYALFVGLQQIVERIGDPNDPSVQGQLTVLEALIGDFEELSEFPPNFV